MAQIMGKLVGGIKGHSGKSNSDQNSPYPNTGLDAGPEAVHKSTLSITDPNSAKVGPEDQEEYSREFGVESLGVSIGRQQTRLASPRTPAAEKSAALDQMNSWGFFDDAVDKEQEELLRNTLQNSVPSGTSDPQEAFDTTPEQTESASDVSTTSTTPPSEQEEPQLGTSSSGGDLTTSQRISRPVWVEPEPGKRTQDTTAVATNHAPQFTAPAYHKRFRSSTLNILSDSGVGKLHSTLSFPSLSKAPKMFRDFSLFPSGNVTKEKRDLNASEASRARSSSIPKIFPLRGKQNNQLHSKSDGVTPNTTMSPVEKSFMVDGNDGSEAAKAQLQRNLSQTRPKLRRSLSYDTMTLSKIESYGSFGYHDDVKWENINAQVNSRMKAIKDTLHDSMPDIPRVNFGALKPNVIYKNGAFTVRPQKPSKAEDRTESPKRLLVSKYSTLEATLEELTGDLVVLGGYRGSVLRSAEPPHRQLWAPVKVGLNMRKVNLEIGLNPEDEENMEDHIFPSGMLTHIGPIDISRRFLKKLRQSKNAKEGKLRIHNYGYDWRLSAPLLSRNLIRFLEGLPCNREGVPDAERGATVICHSMGGLITRHAVNARPELFAGVAYIGTPQSCVNILGPLRMGDEVGLSSTVLTAQVNFTFRSSYIFLPESGQCFINAETKEPYRVNFFDAETWKTHALSPCVAPCVPASKPQRRSIFGSFSNSSQNLRASQSNNDSDNNNNSAPDEVLAQKIDAVVDTGNHPAEPQMKNAANPPSTTTIPIEEATVYLKRTLAEALAFKKALKHRPSLEAANKYPPHAIMYSTGIPTVYGAKVSSRDAIKRCDAYENLAFASGDGVVLARAAMIPKGYKVAENGRVLTNRGHVTMLSDFEAVGKCLAALVKARREGVGLGAKALGPSAEDGLE